MKLKCLVTILCYYIFHVLADNHVEKFFNDPTEITFIGTHYCGPGNTAKNYDDLGSEKETDICCRDHDSCPDLIEAGKERHGLENKSSYTRLHCSCDWAFYRCLKKVVAEKNSYNTAKMIGTIYFDLLNTKCYDQKPRISGCTRYSGNERCKHYYFFKESELLWQWFDVPKFY